MNAYPGELQGLLDAIAENAALACGADDAIIALAEDDLLRDAAHYGPMSVAGAVPISRRTHVGRALLDQATIHVRDVLSEDDPQPEDTRELATRYGYRTLLVTCLHRGGDPVGAIIIRRREAMPFTERQITQLETFAHLAAVAIDNARLNRELADALERETATSEVLRIISSAPTDVQRVLDAIAEKAATVCDAQDAVIELVEDGIPRIVAHYGPLRLVPPPPGPIDPERLHYPVIVGRATLHIPDILQERAYPKARVRSLQEGMRTILATPLMREGAAIGMIVTRRAEVQPFTDEQVQALKGFADQAVIAIENARLFDELQAQTREQAETLEEQAATNRILEIISQSPSDVQPVLDALVQSAARLCDVQDVVLRLATPDGFVIQAHTGPVQVRWTAVALDAPHVEWMREHGTLYLVDVQDEQERAQRQLTAFVPGPQTRTFLVAPLRRGGEILGNFTLRREEVRPFTERQIKLIETFADQAVIAIQNTRLFKELQTRNQELNESLEHQTATAAVLGVIASAPTDLQPVLDAIAEKAATVCGAEDGAIRLVEDGVLRLVAHRGPLIGVPTERAVDSGSPIGRAVLEGRTIHVLDLWAAEDEFPATAATARSAGTRTMLATPLKREGQPIGGILIRRSEVRPFTERQVALLEIFADQASIAIENARLFNDLKAALDHQTATSEVLKIISSSTTDINPVYERPGSTNPGDGERFALSARRWTDGDHLVPPAPTGP